MASGARWRSVWCRWALPRPYGGARDAAAALRALEGRRMCGRAGRQRRRRAGRVLGAFRRRPRPSLLILPCSADIARCAVCRRFSRFPMEDSGSGCSAAVLCACFSGFLTVRALVGALHANAGPAACAYFLTAHHRPPAAFWPRLLVLRVEAAAHRWFYRVGRPRNTPGAS